MESATATQAQDVKEKVATAKEVLYEQFCQQYGAISQFINRLPIPLNVKSIIAQKFDEGFLWTKEAFQMISFDAPKLAPISVVDLPKEDTQPPVV